MKEVNIERSKQPRERTQRQRQRFLRELNSFTNSLPPEQIEHKEAANNHPVVQFTSLTNSGYIFLLDISSPTLTSSLPAICCPYCPEDYIFLLHSAASWVSSFSVNTLLDLSLYSVHTEKLNRGQWISSTRNRTQYSLNCSDETVNEVKTCRFSRVFL